MSTPAGQKAAKAAKPPKDPRDVIQANFVLGLLLVVLGLAIMFSTWPSAEVYGSSFLDDPVVTKSGSELGVFVGAVMASIGQIMLAIAVIAAGVRLGNRASAKDALVH